MHNLFVDFFPSLALSAAPLVQSKVQFGFANLFFSYPIYIESSNLGRLGYTALVKQHRVILYKNYEMFYHRLQHVQRIPYSFIFFN